MFACEIHQSTFSAARQANSPTSPTPVKKSAPSEMTEKERRISHFTHPAGHVLLPVYGQSTVYTCGLCKIQAKEIRFRCTTCPDFILDPVCAACGPATTSFMHPDHNLVFLISPDSTVDCAVCNQGIDGGHYTCCDFHVHPLCTKFPEIVKAGLSPAHEYHELKGVFSSAPATCHVCLRDFSGFRYQCQEGCGVDLHPCCLNGFCHRDVAGSTSRSAQFLKTTFEIVRLGIELWDLLRRIDQFYREWNPETYQNGN